jgi:hypothetical protein
MNIRFARTGQGRVDTMTHTIIEEGTGCVLGGIQKRRGEMYEAWDNHVGEIAKRGSITYAQREAIAWYGERERCRGGCGALVHVANCFICTPCAADRYREVIKK